VLSVGDLEFSLKCYKKMSEFRQNGGTVVIVSHNMGAVRRVCDRVLWLSKGKIREIGEVHHICDLYEEDVMENRRDACSEIGNKINYDPTVKILKGEFLDENDQPCTNFKVGGPFKLRIHFASSRIVKNPIFVVEICNLAGVTVISNHSNRDGCKFDQISGTGYVDFCLNKLAFRPSNYFCTIGFAEEEVANGLEVHDKAYVFTVSGDFTNYGLIDPSAQWSSLKCDGEKECGDIRSR